MLSSQIRPALDMAPNHPSWDGVGAVNNDLIAISWMDAWARAMLCLFSMIKGARERRKNNERT
jgi:hypothetical protein